MVLNGLNALQSEISTKMFLQTSLNYKTFVEECQAIPKINLFFLRDKSSELVHPIISLGCHQIQNSTPLVELRSTRGRFNSPTPTRRRIKSSRNVGELVFNPVQLIRS